MREILFRGKRADNGEWVEGFYYKFLGSFIKEKETSVSTPTHIVLPETVCQFTGLTDRNGNKIFEGDIVTVDGEGIVAAVKYRDDKSAFFVENDDGEDYFGEAETDVIVIGNIHDNPELISGDENAD